LHRDVVILRSGTREQGVLSGCSSTSCSLDGKSHRRDDIFLIGLGVVSPDVPPLIEDPLQDSVHLRNASVLKARVLGINTQTVATAQGSKTRKDVSWVYLAPPKSSAPKSDARPHPSAKDKAKETRDAPRPAPTSGDGTVKTAQRWIGEARWTWKVTPEHLIISTAKVRLRVGDTGASNELLHDGSTIHVKHETLGGDCIFRGQGTSPAEGTAGFIIRPQEVISPTGERRMDPWTYTLFLTPARDPTWTVTCEGVDGPYTHTHGGAAGLSQAFIGAHDDDPEIVRVFDLQSGRMEGSYRVPGKYEKTVRWSICREGVTCPPLERDDPTPPPNANKCSLPRNLRAMLALALAEQHALQPRTDDKSLNE
jgi:hypothetical protein